MTRRKLITLFSVVGATVILSAWFAIEHSQTEEVERVVELKSLSEAAEVRKLATADPGSPVPLVEPRQVPSEDRKIVQEALSARENVSPDKYKVGAFFAPEQLEVAVLSAVNEKQPRYSAFVDDMECDSGDCEIVIRLVGSGASSAAVANIMQRINTQFGENPLTQDIIIGLRSVQIDENRELQAVFVTMPRPPDETVIGASE